MGVDDEDVLGPIFDARIAIHQKRPDAVALLDTLHKEQPRSAGTLALEVNDPFDAAWFRSLPAPLAAPSEESFAGRIHVAAEFRDLVAPLLEAGANVVITTDSLRSSGAEALPFQIEDDAGAAPPD